MAKERLVALKELPEGLFYLPDFISAEVEEHILEHIEALPFAPYVMGSFVAKRTVVQFGGQQYRFNYGGNENIEAMPDWLVSTRERCATIINQNADILEQVLVARYENAGIGWHRDAPQFGPCVIGISFGKANTMRFRRVLPGIQETFRLDLAPRSLYIMSGSSRAQWQHSMPESKGLRFSVTFRTISDNDQNSNSNNNNNNNNNSNNNADIDKNNESWSQPGIIAERLAALGLLGGAIYNLKSRRVEEATQLSLLEPEFSGL